MVRIDRVIDWDYVQTSSTVNVGIPSLMYFLDFNGPINVVVEVDGRIENPDEIPEDYSVDMSKITPYGEGVPPRISVMKSEEEFYELRSKWLKEPHDTTKQRLEKPDHLLAWALSKEPEYSKDKTTTKHIMKLVFRS